MFLKEDFCIVYQPLVSYSMVTAVLSWSIIPEESCFGKKMFAAVTEHMNRNVLSELERAVTLWTLIMIAMDESKLWKLILDRAVQYY